MIEAVEDRADLGKSILPADGQIAVAVGIVAERMRQAAMQFQLVIGEATKLADGVAFEEIRRGAFFGRLPGDGLDAVLAKFERRAMGRIAPGASGTIEAVRLIGLEHSTRAGNRPAALQQSLATAF